MKSFANFASMFVYFLRVRSRFCFGDVEKFAKYFISVNLFHSHLQSFCLGGVEMFANVESMLVIPFIHFCGHFAFEMLKSLSHY